MVKKRDLTLVMDKIRELRAFTIKFGIDPWTIRQAIIMALEMDTRIATNNGIKPEDIKAFDDIVKQDINAWIDREEHALSGCY